VNEVRIVPDRLRRRFDPSLLAFETTEELEPAADFIGQPRAREALTFGLEVSAAGHNIFAAGPIGTGRRTMIEDLLRRHAAERASPGDWVYLFDFDAEEQPLAVQMPQGRGRQLASDMRRLVEECRRQITRAFDSEEYHRRRQELIDDLEQQREEALGELRRFAGERGLTLEMTPAGLMTIPVIEGKPVPPSDFSRLPKAVRDQYRERSEEVEKRLPSVNNRMREIERHGNEALRKLDREVTLFAIGHLVDELINSYAELDRVTAWLRRVREDVIEHLAEFRSAEGESGLPGPIAATVERAREQFFGRYEPNLFVSNAEAKGAPVVVETNPTFYNLFGRIEYETTLGAITTGHRHIRAGAIHRANGGYLLLNAADVLREPFVWPRLKEALRSREIGIENIGAQLTLFPTATLEPKPIELDVKVVLIGTPLLYALMYLLDEDLRKLFKVKVEFDVETELTKERAAEYAAFIARRVGDDDLIPFDREAVARVIEFASRRAEHREKLSVRFIEISDLVAEAAHWAGKANAALVGAAHVEQAIEQRIRRSNLLEERVQERITEGTLMIDLSGERVGQLNGLSVASVGDYEFGRPTRITAITGLGEGEVLNIDRETELSGPIHSKGVLILTGFLRERFGGGRPLAMGASIVFEQSYEEVEGDSASAAELFALLSSLAESPIRQGVAVTGSVNQHGLIQPVGAINEKVEGFFDVCKRRGLSGEMGVIIPSANLRHLMLRQEVVDAVRDGEFNVWAIETVDQGIEVLTGVPAGGRRADGTFPEDTINGRADRRLEQMAETARHFQRPSEKADEPRESGRASSD
jgi:lon-related putative ATP-dependent protease